MAQTTLEQNKTPAQGKTVQPVSTRPAPPKKRASAHQIRILGVPTNPSHYNAVIDEIEYWIEEKSSRYVCIAPVHSVVEGWRTQTHRAALEQADLVTADGMPIVWAQRLLGGEAQRVYGPTLMQKLLRVGNEKGHRIALYGGHPDRLEWLTNALVSVFPKLQVVCHISPPFRELSEEERDEIIEKINAAKPDIVWVGLGCPKQEKWMMEHRGRINAVMLGVGAAFDFLAGAVKQAPGWMQKSGLEWFFRLLCEPRRLWKRYLVTNTLFVVGFSNQLIRHFLLGKRES